MSSPRVDHEEELSIDEIEAERELRDCADHLAPSGDQSSQRREQAQRLLTVLRRAVPDGQVEVVGSEATGLSSRHSDVDIMVISPPQYPADAAKRGRSESATNESPVFGALKAALVAEYPKGVSEVRDAKVALLRVREGRFHADISFDNRVAALNTAWAKGLVEKHPLLAPLQRLLRFWMRNRGIPDAKCSGVSSHALFLMLAHALLVGRFSASSPLLSALRAFFAYYAQEFDYATHVVSADPANLLPTREQLGGHFSAQAPYPSSLAIADQNEQGRNLTAWMPPSFLLLLLAEMRGALSWLASPTAAGISALLKPVPSMGGQISEQRFYLALLPDSPQPLRVVYARLLFTTPPSSGEELNIKACRWNARNVSIKWSFFDLVDPAEGLFQINRHVSLPVLPTAVLCQLDHPARISPAPRTITLGPLETLRIGSFGATLQAVRARWPSFFSGAAEFSDPSVAQEESLKRRRR